MPATALQDQTTVPWSDYTLSHLGADSRLYNGLEYIRNGIVAKGFAFFEIDSLRPGTLCYDGLGYRHVPMEYDLVEDELVIPYFTGSTLISLVNEKLNYFSIGDHHFRYIDAGKTGSVLPRSGFYEELYRNGATAVLARREKKLVYPSNRDEQPWYTQTNTYFLLLNARYYPIAGERDLLDTFSDKKDAVKKYLRKSKIRFKKNPEAALVQATGYYLQINH